MTRIALAVVIPRILQRPEAYGGGYVRFAKTSEYLKRYFDIVFVDFRPQIRYLSLFITPLVVLKRLRKKRISAVLVITDSFMDIMLGYTLAALLRTKLIVFVNTIPPKGHVGYGETEGFEKGLFMGILSAVSSAEPRRPVAFVKALALYVMVRCLSKSITVPLAPHLVRDLRKMHVTYVPIHPGVGCSPPSLNNHAKRITGLYLASPLHPQKGVFDVLEIWRKVLERRPGAKLVVAGKVASSFSVAALRKRVKELGLEDNVAIVVRRDAIPNPIVLKLMSQAQVFVYPSRKDVCPLVIGEALSVGTPVVTYDLPGIKFAYGNCEAVIRVPMGDIQSMATKVLEILEKPQLAERLRQAAVEWCKANPWSRAARKEAEAYLFSLLK